MDHANAVLCGEEEPTVDDFIEWVEEEAVRMGMIGFRTEYASLEEIFADVSMKTGSVKEFEEIDSLEDCATVEMLRIHQDIDMMERRMKIMKANPLLLARAEVQVDKKLLAAGKLQEDIASYPKGRNGLRVKVMDLHALNHPIAPVTGPPRGISALVVLGEKLDRRIPVTLPVKATLAEVCKLLDGTCASEDYLTKGWHQAPTDKRIWKYRFIAGGEKSRDLSSSTRLFTDADYQHLIQQATEKNKGQNSQLVVLILDVPPEIKPVEEKERPKSDEYVPWNPLDENGVPYFDPVINWDRVQFDEATGQVKEPDLDRTVRELEALPH